MCKKAITIDQPFANLFLSGQKKYEYRTWKTNYRGILYIHVSKKCYPKKSNKYLCQNCTNCIAGMIVAKVELTDCIPIANINVFSEQKQLSLGETNILKKFAKSHQKQIIYAFEFKNKKTVKNKFQKGKQKIWNFK